MFFKTKKIPQLVTEGRFFLLASRVPARLRWAATLVVLIFVFIVFFLFFFMPLRSRFSRLKESVRFVEGQKRLLSEKIRQNELSNKMSRKNNLSLKNNEKFSRSFLAKSIVSLARDVGVVCLYVNDINNDVSGIIDVSVRGSFDNVLKFFDGVQRIRRNVSVKKFTCSRSSVGAYVESVCSLKFLEKEILGNKNGSM